MLNLDTIAWISNIQMEFTTHSSRKIAFVTIDKAFQGVFVTIYRCEISANDVDANSPHFFEYIMNASEKIILKKSFKSTKSAKEYVAEKSIAGNYVLFDLKTRKHAVQLQRITLIHSGTIERRVLDRIKLVEKLSNLFKDTE